VKRREGPSARARGRRGARPRDCQSASASKRRFVFLDETGTATSVARRYGHSLSQRRLVAAVPHGRWRTTRCVAGLRQSGIVAPLVLDGPMTGLAFRAYVEQLLAPAIAAGDVVVLDDLAAHNLAPSAARVLLLRFRAGAAHVV
jgi:hypothetical protein